MENKFLVVGSMNISFLPQYSLYLNSGVFGFCVCTENLEDGVAKMNVFEVDKTPFSYSSEHGDY